MIQSFGSRATERIFHRIAIRKLAQNIQRVVLRKLWMLDAAADLQDLRVPPANRLEKLHDDRAGQYSIRVNDQWRSCFTWKDGRVYHVELTDYH